MKTYKVELTEDFIKKAHKRACPDWKTKIEELVPEAFEEKTLGKWTVYRNSTRGNLVFNAGSVFENYGFLNGYWNKSLESYSQLATDKEVKEALIKEAKKRGLVEGVEVQSLFDSYKDKITKNYELIKNNLYVDTANGSFCIMTNGEWAKPIENPTLKRIEEIEEELKQLKEKL